MSVVKAFGQDNIGLYLEGDNLVINDKENGKNYLILMIYLDFVEFDEEITYAK